MITTTKKTKVKKTTNTNIKFPNLFLCCKHVQFIHYSHSHYTVPLLRCRDLFSLASVTEEYLQDIPKLYKHLHCIWVLHNSWREFRRSSQRISLPYFILTLQTWHSGLHSTFSFTFWKNPPPPPPRRAEVLLFGIYFSFLDLAYSCFLSTLPFFCLSPNFLTDVSFQTFRYIYQFYCKYSYIVSVCLCPRI